MAPTAEGSGGSLSSNSSFKSFSHSPVSEDSSSKLTALMKVTMMHEAHENTAGGAKSVSKKGGIEGCSPKVKKDEDEQFVTPVSLNPEDLEEDALAGADGNGASSAGLLSEIFTSAESNHKSFGSTGSSGPREVDAVIAGKSSNVPLASILTDPPGGGTKNRDLGELAKSGGFQSVTSSASSNFDGASLLRELTNDLPALFGRLMESQAFQLVAAIILLQVPLFIFIDYFFK